jgi:hypothetical protein
MLFINPMWDNESERIGKQKCTPLGYRLHVISDLIGFIGLLLLLVIAIYLGYRGFAGSFRMPLLWLLAIPFAIGIIGSALFSYSWIMARKRDFRYDPETREASWLENGQRCVYKWKA